MRLVDLQGCSLTSAASKAPAAFLSCDAWNPLFKVDPLSLQGYSDGAMLSRGPLSGVMGGVWNGLPLPGSTALILGVPKSEPWKIAAASGLTLFMGFELSFIARAWASACSIVHIGARFCSLVESCWNRLV